MHLVVGLGNPGRKYEQTRHNVGFCVVDRLGARSGVQVERKQLGALVESARIADRPAVLAKPQGFMNLSGGPVASLRGYYKAQTTEVVVVHDDLDLPFGEVRVKVGGGHGGHNGLRDVNRAIGPDYVRVRVGVGRPPQGWDAADYVLSRWTGAEAPALDGVVDRAADAVEAVVRVGPSAAMNTFNVSQGRSAGDASLGAERPAPCPED
jgi:peptidyl-tRNA hydrolase, PTH1 family